MILKIGDKELQIKFAYKPTVKAGIIGKLVRVDRKTGDEDNAAEHIEDILTLIPELILVGLQHSHKNEYGYDYDTNEGQKEQLDKIYEALDEYFDSDESDLQKLYTDLQQELLNNGFLASLFRQETQKAEQKAKTARKTKTEN